MAERKTPILLRRGPLSDEVYAITRYTIKDDRLTAHAKYSVTDDFRHLMLEHVLGDPGDDLQPILVGAARGEELTDDERDLIGQMADRLGDDIRALGLDEADA